MKHTGKKILSLLLAVLMLVGLAVPTGILAQPAKAEAGEVPAHGKTATPNGDGTTKLELSVTGDADYDAEPVKVNVIIVLDTSGSMDFLIPSTTGSRGSTATDGDTRNNNFQLYRNTGGNNYTAISDSDGFTGTAYTRSGNQWTGYTYSVYNGTRYSTTSRMDATKTSVNNLIDTLISQNTNDHPDTIEISLITFATNGSYNTPSSATANNWVSGTSATSFKSTVSDLDATGGTNWDDALYRANALAAEKAQVQPDEKVYIVFFSDGEPTFSNSNNNSDSPTSHTHQTGNNSSNDGGGTNGGTTTQAREYNSAYYHANQIHNTTYVAALYGIFAFGTEESYMKTTISYGNYGDATHADGVAGSLYFNANSSEDIEKAFKSIASSIIEAVGITAVSITDGTTNQVTTSTGVAELLEVDESSYEYWLSWNVSAGTNEFSSFIDGQVVPCTAAVNGDNIVITWDGGTATYQGTKEGNVIKVKWTGKTDFYDFAPPAASFENGAVDWDLSDVGTLLNGVTYSVTFDVYSSQTTLDIIADIKNDPSSYSSLDENIKKYIDENGKLKTNTTATLTYSDTRLDNPGPKTAQFDDPEPVDNSAVEELAVSKEWLNLLDENWEKPDSITLNVTRDDDPHYTVTLSDANSWASTVFISLGIMGADGKPLAGSEGHDFTFTEPATSEGYKWEINAPVVHPMLINNKKTILIKEDDNHQAPEGATTYKFNNATYYVDNAAVSLTATNERRSSINLVKTVTGVDIPENAVFPFTLNVKDSLAPATAPSAQDDPGHDSDYWIWISIWDKDQQNVTEGAVVSGATHAGGSWYYGESGKNIVLNVKNGYSIRINNLPVGSEFSITEGEDLPTGFVYVSTDSELTKGEGVWTINKDRTTTGEVATTNAVYTITYTNKYELVDINVDKVWDDNNNQDGKRPTDLTLTLGGLPSGTTAPTPIITKSEDGNTWTYVWKGLPRYDTNGNEITTNYTVTEGTVPEGYTCETTTVGDGGTITNVHTPEETTFTVTKNWDDSDDIGDIRPANITVQLFADGEASGDPVTLTADKQWTYTWEKLPKYAAGELIVYSADETAVPTGYTKQAPTTGENSVTITNTYSPTPTTVSFPVQKVLSIPEGLTGPETWSFTFNVAAADGAPAPTSTTANVSDTSDTATFTFAADAFKAPGTYTYTVTETGTVDGVTNDGAATTGKTVTVTVSDDGTGKLTATASSTTEKPLIFTNTYSAEPTTVSFPVQKVLSIPEGLTGPGTWSFTFNVAAADGAPAPTSTTANVSDTGDTATFTFAADAFKAPGTYTYTVTENGELDGVTNDGAATTGKTVTVTVTDNKDGTLIAEASSTEKNPLAFTNTYGATGSVELEVTKAIEGAAWPSGKTLTLTLTGTGTAPMPTTTTATLSAEGNVSFGPIAYTEADAGQTYTYTISEDGFGTGWSGSGNVTATVKVTDNGDGTLATEVTYTPTDATIINTYKADGTATIIVTKALAGAGWPEGKTLTLTLSGSSGAPMPETTTAALTAIGNASFGPIEYTEADAGKEYTYTISEDGFGAGWSGSGDITATVKVTDAGEGKLTTEVTYTPTDATITNTYKATGEAVLEVTKKLAGAGWPSGKTLTLTLTGEGGTLPETKTVTLTAEGKATFGAIKYTEADIDKEYTYVITEDGFGAGWSGSGNVTATVKVTDAGGGKLSTKVTYTNDATITNTYSADGEATIIVTKALSGAAWPEGKTLTLTLKGTGDAPMPGTTTTKLTAIGNASFGPIKYTEADVGKTYTYTITEDGFGKGWTSSGDVTATVIVTDAGGGKLAAEVKYSPENATITNKYSTKEITVDPKDTSTTFGIKSLTATTEDGKAQTFEFTLAAETEGAPMPGESAIASLTYEAGKTGDQIIPFGTITYTEPGTYEYSITETKLGSGWSTTGSPAKVTVVITDNGDGTLSAKVTGSTITNKYAPGEITVDPKDTSTTFGTKSLTATTEDGKAQTFEFTLEAVTTGAPMPESATASLTYEAGKTGDQIIPFGTITYTEPGTYEYSITETKLGDGWSTTGSPAKVTVVITDEGDGTLSAKVTGSTITNKYAPGEITVDPKDTSTTFGTKSLTATTEDGKAQTFEFTLKAETTGAPMPESATASLTYEAGKTGDQIIPFGTITYTEPGTYEYSIIETELGDGWSTTGSPAKVTVVITDNGDGTLSAEVTGSTITNKYTPGKQVLSVEKKWEDAEDVDKLRPESIDVNLLLNGEICETQTLSASNGWKYSWEIPISKDLIYSVDEDVVPAGYLCNISGSVEKGYIITNVHEITPPSPPPVIRIEIVKVWEDDSNASGTRTETVEVTLLKGGVANLTRDLGDSNEWKYEGYVEAGYDYKVVETPVEGYDSIVTQSPIPGGIRFTVTNKLTKTPDLNTKDHVAYIVGYPDGTVRPDRQITRAEVATIFFRLLTDEARDKFWSQTNPYPDVKADDWFNNAISTLTKMGIINGYEDGTFRPNNPITRAELTKMAVSFFSSADKFFGKTPSFSDVPADAWYTRFIAAAEELGLINGYPDGTFRPNNYITRAETCTIVNRTLGRGPHKDHLLPEEVMINWPDNLPTQWYYEQIQEATNSHDYEWITEIIEKTTVEQWLAKLPERDWVALEQIWSTAHSAPGGEVMG